MRRTALHFVRCIKPNNEQAQDDYDAALVLHQLRCCGITEVTRIARAGYPTRYGHAQFAHRYSSLLGNAAPRARALPQTLDTVPCALPCVYHACAGPADVPAQLQSHSPCACSVSMGCRSVLASRSIHSQLKEDEFWCTESCVFLRHP